MLGCVSSVTCNNNGTCTSESGICNCNTGLTGNSCDTCQQYYYGNKCSQCMIQSLINY